MMIFLFISQMMLSNAKAKAIANFKKVIKYHIDNFKDICKKNI